MVSILIFPLLANFSLAIAQDDNTDASVRRLALEFVDAFNTATRAKNVDAFTKLYAENAIIVTPEGPVVGRAAIQKWADQGFQVFSSQAKLERAELLAKGIRIRMGSWSGTLQGKNGPIPLEGRWSTTDVEQGGKWLIRMESFNVKPPPESAEAK
jgi:ketosteroid isomerase-like protein